MLESKDAKCQIHVNLFTANVTKSINVTKSNFIQHKRGPSSVLLKLLDHVSLMSINTPGTTTSFSFKCSNPQVASFGLCQWFAFTSKILYIQPYWASDPSSPTNSNHCDVPSCESSRKCWVFLYRGKLMPSMWSMRSTMGSTMGSVRSAKWTDATTQGFQLLSQYSSTYTSSHFRSGFSTFKSFGLQVFHSFISFIFWGRRGRFGRRLKNFALHGEC